MAEVNFKCPKTGEEFFISDVRTKFKSDGDIHSDRFGKQLVNPKNNEPLVRIEKPFEGVPNIGKFSALKPHQKKKVLKARSAKHNAATPQKDEFHHKNLTDTQKPKALS